MHILAECPRPFPSRQTRAWPERKPQDLGTISWSLENISTQINCKSGERMYGVAEPHIVARAVIAEPGQSVRVGAERRAGSRGPADIDFTLRRNASGPFCVELGNCVGILQNCG